MIKTVAETWGLQGVQSTPSKLLAEVSRDTVKELVDQFIKVYQEVHPK